MHEGRGYRYTFHRARVASSPEVPKVTWWKIATFLGYHLHWLTSLETSRHFRKIALRLGIFLAMFRECLCVVARQLAPKCRDFSNVAKLARQCKWPYWHMLMMVYGDTWIVIYSYMYTIIQDELVKSKLWSLGEFEMHVHVLYTEHQKKLITSSERRSLISTLWILIILKHR